MIRYWKQMIFRMKSHQPLGDRWFNAAHRPTIRNIQLFLNILYPSSHCPSSNYPKYPQVEGFTPPLSPSAFWARWGSLEPRRKTKIDHWPPLGPLFCRSWWQKLSEFNHMLIIMNKSVQNLRCCIIMMTKLEFPEGFIRWCRIWSINGVCTHKYTYIYIKLIYIYIYIYI